MPKKDAMPVLFFSPFVSSTMAIEPSWIDYNGHLNMAYYHVLFDRAVDEAFELLGLGPDYAQKHQASFFAAEAHVLYRRELTRADKVRITLQLIDYDDKRVHVFLEMRHAQEGWLAASCETLSLHVDLRAKGVTTFPAEILANLAVMKAAHGRMARPEALGRIIGLSRDSRREAGAGHGYGDTRLLN